MHKSIEASKHRHENRDDLNPFDVGLGVWMMTKTIGSRSGSNQ